ncbi:MAG: hypothetical protein ACREQ7_06585 [Candidatus Binatia bacterium]
MTTKTFLTWAGMGVFSALLLNEAALASHYTPRNSPRARAEIRNDWAEIRRGRADLGKDIEEYHENRTALQRAIRRGAPPHVVAQRRAEVRRDLKDIAEGRRDLRRDYHELNQDLEKYRWYRRADGRWYRHPTYGYGTYDNSYNPYGRWNRND